MHSSRGGKTDMVIYASNPTMWEEKQADLCDFEASPLHSEIQTSQSLNTENMYDKIK